MSKYKVDTTGVNGQAGDTHFATDVSDSATSANHGGDDFTTKAAIIGAVVVGAALFEAALIPGIIIGGIAAAFAPKFVPKLGERLQPMFHSTVRGAYKLGRKARSAVGEVQEHMSDIAAEVQAEDVVRASETAAADEGNGKFGEVAAAGNGAAKS